MDGRTNKQIARRTDRQTNRLTDRQTTNRQVDNITLFSSYTLTCTSHFQIRTDGQSHPTRVDRTRQRRRMHRAHRVSRNSRLHSRPTGQRFEPTDSWNVNNLMCVYVVELRVSSVIPLVRECFESAFASKDASLQVVCQLYGRFCHVLKG